MTAYPPPGYAPAPAQPASTGVKLPAGMSLWDLLSLLIILVGAILILVGFLYGDAYANQLGAGGSLSTAQSDIEAFFVASGIGIFLVILGWLCRAMLFPMVSARQKMSPAPAPAMAAPMAAPAAAPAPPAMAPPAAPACANCGKPTTFIAQYGRYYCYSCSRYV